MSKRELTFVPTVSPLEIPCLELRRDGKPLAVVDARDVLHAALGAVGVTLPDLLVALEDAVRNASNAQEADHAKRIRLALVTFR